MRTRKSTMGRPRKRSFHSNQFSKSETSEVGESSRSRTNELVDSRGSSDRFSVVEHEAMSASFVKLGSGSMESGVGGSRDARESSNRSKGLRLRGCGSSVGRARLLVRRSRVRFSLLPPAPYWLVRCQYNVTG